MDEIALRLEALRLAAQPASGQYFDRGMSEEIVHRARLFYDFLTGSRDGEVIAAAQRFAEKVRDATG